VEYSAPNRVPILGSTDRSSTGALKAPCESPRHVCDKASPTKVRTFRWPGNGHARFLDALDTPWMRRVCVKFVGGEPTGNHPTDRCSQNSSQRPLSWEQRRAIIALAWLTVQRIPDCFSRCPMIVLQPASTTPEPTKRPWLRNWA
jgi:hypothetical protein